MMMRSPKSLTAVVHVKFCYGEEIIKQPGEAQVEMLSKVMDSASEMSPEFQEVLVQFADYLAKGVTSDKKD